MDRRPRQPSEFTEKIVQVNRVSKKTMGGNQIGFSVLVVVGDKKGRVGVALGKAPDVLSSIKKGVRKAKKRFVSVPLKNDSIPFRIVQKYGAATVMLKPAPHGSGVIAGGAVRDVLEVAGIKNVVGKILGSNNQANNAYATVAALQQLDQMCRTKGLDFKTPVMPTETKLPKPSEPAKPQPAGSPKTKNDAPKTRKKPANKRLEVPKKVNK